MARTVADAALLLGAMAGADPADAASAASQSATSPTRLHARLDADALQGARIGVARKQYFGYSDVTDRLIDQAIADMKAQGAVIVDPADIPTAAKMDGCENEVLSYEFKADLNKYLAALGPAAPVHSLEELIAFDSASSRARCPTSVRSSSSRPRRRAR